MTTIIVAAIGWGSGVIAGGINCGFLSIVVEMKSLELMSRVAVATLIVSY